MEILYISSSDFKDLYPNNKPNAFTFELQEPLKCDADFVCGLTEINYTSQNNEFIYIYCDIISYSVIGDKKLPILRITNESQVFTNPYFISLKQYFIKRINIKIFDKSGGLADLTGDTMCVLVI